jgi:EAL domain-containing protein (putative c-di-GMP-specific phosphodiesterase class I)
MVFQPIVHLGTGTVVGCEALSRFHFPPYRTPELWYREAWSVGMGMDLELTALRRAFAAAPELPKNSYLCVNVSPALIGSNALDEAIPEALASRVVLELTEHTSVDDYTILAEALRTLRRRGIRLAIDDAGAGFSSLRHVLRLTPEFIKLDASLTRSLDVEPKRWALVDSLLGFADRIGAVLIAEGIEDPADMRTLKDIGLRYGQGHILCRPIGPPVPDTVPVD